MLATDFVQDMLGSGRLKVPRDPAEPQNLGGAVRELDRLARPDLPFDPPPLVPAVGEWALLRVYRACQALVHRDVGPDAVRAALAEPCPVPPSPAACYSADLAFRVLPDLIGLARGVAADDPLVAGLEALARAWPLSSVGVAGLGDVDVRAFVEDPCLLRLYADRVIERADVSRTVHPRVRDAVRAAVGAFPDLAPKLAATVVIAARADDPTPVPEEPACP